MTSATGIVFIIIGLLNTLAAIFLFVSGVNTLRADLGFIPAFFVGGLIFAAIATYAFIRARRTLAASSPRPSPSQTHD